MKRINFIAALLSTVCISLAGCGTSESNSPVATEHTTIEQNTQTAELEASTTASATEGVPSI